MSVLYACIMSALSAFSVLQDHSSGPGQAIGTTCVCVCMSDHYLLNQITSDLDIACWLVMTLSRSCSRVKVIGQTSRSHDELFFIDILCKNGWCDLE